MSTVVLGVSGSVACYRACDIARALMRAGHTVRVCLTYSATQFVQPALFEALTGQPCLVSSFDEPERGRMAHIDWARDADLVLVAPATANVINKLAAGFADDMVTTIAVAYEGTVVVAPAMNPSMYADETTQRSVAALAERGVVFVEPSEGDVACGEQGQGRLAPVDDIVEAALAVLDSSRTWSGVKVLVTSGPTQEPLDDVRFLSNRSSGKMGAALAQAALLRGASVTVVTGPTSVPLPRTANVVRVRTASEMLDACQTELPGCGLVIGAAAVADFRVANPRTGKPRRQDGPPELKLEANPDIIATLAGSADLGCRVVAFAAEPGTSLDGARKKLIEKKVAGVAVNDVSDPEIGFDSDRNHLVLLTPTGDWESPRASKLVVSLWLLDTLSKLT